MQTLFDPINENRCPIFVAVFLTLFFVFLPDPVFSNKINFNICKGGVVALFEGRAGERKYVFPKTEKDYQRILEACQASIASLYGEERKIAEFKYYYLLASKGPRAQIENLIKLSESGLVQASIAVGLLKKDVLHESDHEEFFLEAARSGNSFAYLTLAFMYLRGDGVQQNFPAALRWFKRADVAGESEATLTLGQIYHGGKIVERDLNVAQTYYEKASEKGLKEAVYYMYILKKEKYK